MAVALSGGANMNLDATSVRIEVRAEAPLDVSAMLLDGNGKVRSDADLIFYNQPQAQGVAYQSGSISIELGRVQPDVEKIVVTASVDGQGATFAGVEPVAMATDATTGQALATFTATGLTTETALLVMELYRRGAQWKLRALGQGYANGLAGIATDFGVDIGEPAPQPVQPEPFPSAPYPQAPPMQPQQPFQPAPPQPFQPTQPEPFQSAPPAQPQPFQASPPQPFQSAPPAQPQAFQPTQPAHFQPTPPSQAVPPFQAGPPAPVQKVNLDKGKVSLEKGGSVSLMKGGSPYLQAVRMGLGWEPAFGGRKIDLDASCIAFDAARREVATVSYRKLNAFHGAIKHSGDNLTGAGAGDDETITVDLGALPPEVASLVFVVTSYSGQKLSHVAMAYCRLIDPSGAELVRYNLTGTEPRTAVMLCKLTRQYTGEWDMTALGVFGEGKTAKDLVGPAAAYL